MKKTIVILLGLMASLLSIQAALDFSDTFNYADGSIVNNSSGIWVQNTGTAGSCLVSNQVLLINTARTEDIAHRLTTVYATNGPVPYLYASFSLKCTNGLPTAAGTYFAHFTGTNTFGLSGFRARIWASITNNAGGATDTSGNFYLYIVNSAGSTTNGGNQSIALSTNGTVYTVVVRYGLLTGLSTLWINPSAETDPGVSDSIPQVAENPAAAPTNGILNISHFSFRQATGEGSLQIDNLKIGTSFSDVAGANTSPTISPIPAQSTPANVAVGPINFTVGDDGGTAGLILTQGSSNPTLIPTNNIVLGGSGASRTVTVTPAAGQQGSGNVTIFVSDGVNISPMTFTVTVGAPTISAIANQITYSNVAPVGPISFTVGDAEGDTLTFSKGSSNPTLLPTNNVVVTGSGSTRTVTLTPAADQTGVSTVTLYVSDGFNTNSTSFVLSVSPKLGVLFSDTFSYTDFLQDTALLDATGSPWAHASGTNYDLLVINGAAQLSGARSEDLAAALAAPAPFAYNSGVVLYTSFTITFSNLPSNLGDYFAHLKNTATGSTFRSKIYANTANAAAGHYRIGIANAANNVSAQFPLDLATNQTYLIVMRYNSGTAESVLWVNPSNEGSTSVAASDLSTPDTIGFYGLRQADTIGTSYLDNLIIGTSFSDVATITVTPIPLSYNYSAGAVALSWTDSSFTLQSSTNVAGPYLDVPGATSPFTTNAVLSTLPAQFFRLHHP
jgi:hypothetical protein